jgi:hypothetical protein
MLRPSLGRRIAYRLTAVLPIRVLPPSMEKWIEDDISSQGFFVKQAAILGTYLALIFTAFVANPLRYRPGTSTWIAVCLVGLSILVVGIITIRPDRLRSVVVARQLAHDGPNPFRLSGWERKIFIGASIVAISISLLLNLLTPPLR